jgi:hypothetical protein
MQTNHATPEFVHKTLDLFRLILHGVFKHDQATEMCVSIRTDDDGDHLVSIAANCDAFSQLLTPVGRLKSVISETCRTLAVVCRDRAVIHRGAVSNPIKPPVQNERAICSIGAELRCADPCMRKALLELVETLMPPPNIHLEVQGRHVRSRAPLRLMELIVGDDATGKSRLTGELYGLPPKIHDGQEVYPAILVVGIPVGICKSPYQFNITAGLGLKDAEVMIPEINLALEARMPSPLKNGS